MSDRHNLNLWAVHGEDVEHMLGLIDTMERNGHIEWVSTAQPRKVVCEYFGIDLPQLEVERRALLEHHREALTESKVHDDDDT